MRHCTFVRPGATNRHRTSILSRCTSPSATWTARWCRMSSPFEFIASRCRTWWFQGNVVSHHRSITTFVLTELSAQASALAGAGFSFSRRYAHRRRSVHEVPGFDAILHARWTPLSYACWLRRVLKSDHCRSLRIR